MDKICITDQALKKAVSELVLEEHEHAILLVANYEVSKVKKLSAISELGIEDVITIDKGGKFIGTILKDISKIAGYATTEEGMYGANLLEEFFDGIPEGSVIPSHPGLMYLVISISEGINNYWIRKACIISFVNNDVMKVTGFDYSKGDSADRHVSEYVLDWSEMSRKTFSSKREEYKYIRDAIRKMNGSKNPIYMFYESVVESMKDCDVLLMEEILDPIHCEAIKSGKIVIEPNHCWSNSYAVLTSPEFDDIKDDLYYCEGFADDGRGYPIEHGWLRYKDTYFDPTAEMIYPGQKVFHDYTSIIEVGYDEARNMVSTTGQHGYNNLAMIAKRFLASKFEEFGRKMFSDKARKVSDEYVIKTLKELSEKIGDNDLTRDGSTLHILNMPDEFRSEFEKAIDKNYKGVEFEYHSDEDDFYEEIEEYADKIVKRGLRDQLKKYPGDIFIGSVGQIDWGDEGVHEYHDYAGFIRVGLDKKDDIFNSSDLY